MLPVTQAGCCDCCDWPDAPRKITDKIKELGYTALSGVVAGYITIVGVPIIFFALGTAEVVKKISPLLTPNPSPLLVPDAPSDARNPLLLPEVMIGVLSHLPQEERMDARTVCKVWDSTFIKSNGDDISAAHARPHYFIVREASKKYDFAIEKYYNRRCFRVLYPAIKESIKETLKIGLIFAGMYFVGGKISQNYTCRLNEINSFSQGTLQMMLGKFNASPYCGVIDDCLMDCRPRLPSEMLTNAADLVQMLLGEARGIKILGLGVVVIVGSACAFPHIKKIVNIIQEANLNFNRNFERTMLLEEIEYKSSCIDKMGLFPTLDRHEHFTKRKTGFWNWVERSSVGFVHFLG